MEDSLQYKFEEEPSNVSDLRLFLVETENAQDITGPIRIAREHQEELLIDGSRLLLLPLRDYEAYDEHFSKAGVAKIEKDTAISSKEVVAARVPRDARTIPQIWNVHPSNRAILEGVFEMAGAVVRTLGEKTGEIPSAEDFRLRKLLALRKYGKVTMLPPVNFVVDNEQNRLDALDRAGQDLTLLRNSQVAEAYKQKIQKGMMDKSNGRSR